VRIAASERPIFFAVDATRTEMVPYFACHKIIRHNQIPEHSTSVRFKLAVAETGEFNLRVGEQPVLLTAGHFVVLPPDTLLRSDGGMNAGLVYWIGIDPTSENTAHATPAITEEIQALGAALHEHALRPMPITRELLDAIHRYFHLLHGGCTRALPLWGAAFGLLGAVHEALIGQGRVFETDQQALQPALDLIDQRLGQSIRMQDLADICNMSLTPFYATMKRLLGTTPREYINRRRIAKATDMLADPRRTVVDIAADLGYSSSHYFARAFKKVMGCSPQQYRRTPTACA
jgi:AraC-like DNA-binding protein